MAIVVEAATNQIFTATATNPVTFAYTMSNSNSGAGRVLLVAMARDNTTAQSYNGVGMTKLEFTTATIEDGILAYAIDANLPTDGLTHNISFSFSADRTNLDVLILELSGVNQVGTPLSEVNSSSAADPHTIAITPVNDAAPIFLFYYRTENRAMNSQPTGTNHFTTDTGTIHDAKRITQVVGVTPAAATTYTWDPSGSSSYLAFAIELVAAAAGTNMQLQIGDTWKTIDAMQINIGDSWKAVAGAQINIGDSWKTIF